MCVTGSVSGVGVSEGAEVVRVPTASGTDKVASVVVGSWLNAPQAYYPIFPTLVLQLVN